jgi:hypothetical protein
MVPTAYSQLSAGADWARFLDALRRYCLLPMVGLAFLTIVLPTT